MPTRTRAVTRPVRRSSSQPRPCDAAEVASWAQASEEAGTTECLYKQGKITKLVIDRLCAFAETQAHCSQARRDVFSIFDRCLRTPGFSEALGARANTLLCEALGCGKRVAPPCALYDLDVCAGLGTRDALDIVSRLAVPAKFLMLKELAGTRWAHTVVSFVRFFFPEACIPEADSRELAAAAMRVLVELVKLPAFPTCTDDVDPDDRALLVLRSTAVCELLDANVVSVLHRMVQHSHCSIVTSTVGEGDNAEWQAPLALRGIYSLASGSNAQADVAQALDVEIRLQPSLFTNLNALLDVATSRVTKSTCFLALSMVLEEMTEFDLHQVVLASKLPSLVVRELGTTDVPQPLSKMVAYAHSGMSTLYFLMYKHGEEATNSCAEQGAVGAVLHRLDLLVVGAEQDRARRGDTRPVDAGWTDALKHNCVHTFLYGIVFLKNAVIVDKNYLDQLLDADLMKLFWRLKALFAGSTVSGKLRATMDDAMAAFKMVGDGKVEQKLLAYKLEANVAKQRARAEKSAALEQARRDAGVEVKLRDRPEEHYCPIGYEVMVNPVVAADGQVYERLIIERWMEERKTSPLTGAQLSSTVLYPVHALKTLIDDWEESEHDRQVSLLGKRRREDKVIAACYQSSQEVE